MSESKFTAANIRLKYKLYSKKLAFHITTKINLSDSILMTDLNKIKTFIPLRWASKSHYSHVDLRNTHTHTHPHESTKVRLSGSISVTEFQMTYHSTIITFWSHDSLLDLTQCRITEPQRHFRQLCSLHLQAECSSISAVLTYNSQSCHTYTSIIWSIHAIKVWNVIQHSEISF